MRVSIALKKIRIIVLSLTLLALGSSTKAYAQVPLGIINELQQFHPDKGSISISHDDKISQLLNSFYVQNASRPGMQGFRIRIYFDTGQRSREQSELVMNEFMEHYPGISIYRTFDSPYYKVSVGDYRTRDEAQHVLKQLGRKYPKAFIIPEWINFPRID
ncbi:MAG: SPOR domain-containing protein [Tenuifilaceae bacterium]|jgi:hypothetical protein|nr:SPOR domain-containing protein [Tenuifilaceae bacterium]